MLSQRSPIFGVAYTILRRTTKFDVAIYIWIFIRQQLTDNHTHRRTHTRNKHNKNSRKKREKKINMRRGFVFRGQPRSHSQGRLQFWGSFLFMRTSFVAELFNKFDVATRGDSCVSHAFHSKGAEFQGSPFWGVLLYLYLHHLTQNDQIGHDNTYGEGGGAYFPGVSHAIVFAQMRRAVCRRQLSFLFLYFQSANAVDPRDNVRESEKVSSIVAARVSCIYIMTLVLKLS